VLKDYYPLILLSDMVWYDIKILRNANLNKFMEDNTQSYIL